MEPEAVARISGVIFDLDGTLVDSGLDFDAIRREMDLPKESSILAEIARMDKQNAKRCTEILERHELHGAQRAVLIPGTQDFIRRLEHLGIRRAVVTRNSRGTAELTLRHCGLAFDLLFTREDGPAKPDPWAIRRICEAWNLDPASVVLIGDFRFDIDAGKAAGVRTVYFTHGRNRTALPGIEGADDLLESFEHLDDLLAKLGLA